MANGKTDTWYPMYPADYLKDTLDLTLEEDGFYTRALNQVYINKGRIPAEPERLQRLLRVNRTQFSRCKWILTKYFYQDGEQYGNRRADEEIAKAVHNMETARENGKRGGRPKKKPDGIPDGIPKGNPTGYPTPNPEKSSSSSPLNPPFNSPLSDDPAREFREVSPILYAALGIETPSIQEELKAHEAWAELKAMGATPEEFAARAARYRAKWPDMPCTFKAVLANWSQMTPALKRGPVVPVVEYLPDSLLEDAHG